ncbi:alpha/beta hydrolase [Winogradskyella bathintestinalis]|uniref:Alpha/beta hydrolase n=1 Tax=Winogradskyella bathintestinalis TaxID=3035208 RepID=A0ABT7ZVL9_9FLAO|nr:alpha/beta hydrolase [Winogradskyella bathintestinalis]MDN3493041.1 alpha/beta hydrolase [Winogradskyella bathintestinalis]
MTKNYSLLILAALFCVSCASKKYKDIPYQDNETVNNSHQLNVFKPRNSSIKKQPVVIFVHGGYWTEGDKDIYGFLGRNFAKNDIVTVIPSYTLSPNGNYNTMAHNVVEALKWTENNIESFGGNSEQIYLMGHSAGGHLIALVTTNPKYSEDTNSVKGVILNDAAGLDMYSYLQKNPPTTEYHYLTTWTKDPKLWKDASPLYFMTDKMPPFLIYVGQKTYESIKTQNAKFVEKLKNYQPNVEAIYLDKKHVPMMSQFFWPWNDRYDEISAFINKN